MLLSRALLLKREVPDGDTGDAALRAMVADRIREFGQATSRLAAGRYSAPIWGEVCFGVLLEGHTQGARMGRVLAGSDNKAQDLIRGKRVANDQFYYLNRFLEAIEAKDPRYYDEEARAWREDRINARLATYTGRMRGTANEAFLAESPREAEFRWVLGVGVIDHCIECPEFASMGPLLRDDFPTVPGANDTPCLYNCECSLVRADGVRGFSPV